MSVPDRLNRLTRDSQTELTGIDFVYVHNHQDQTTLDVYFVKPPDELSAPGSNVVALGDLTADNISIFDPEGETTRTPIPVEDVQWKILEWTGGDMKEVGDWDGQSDVSEDRQTVLRLHTQHPGDFTWYILRIHQPPQDLEGHPRIDPRFNDERFTFKAGCDSELDCRKPEHECPPEDEPDVPIDYTARDFETFREALLDFASQRMPDWEDRLPADAGVMMVEVLSALADEMSYYQDRIAREAHLETATQRRSVRKHARMVDYPVRDARGARCWVDVRVNAGGPRECPAGWQVWADTEQGGRTVFEIGDGLDNYIHRKPDGTTAWTTYEVRQARNQIEPHIWDEGSHCLDADSTQLTLKGHHAGTSAQLKKGQQLLLKTQPDDPSLPRRRWVIELTEVVNDRDPLLNEPVTRIRWKSDDSTPFELDLTNLTVHGNLLPATAGRTVHQRFVVGSDPMDLDQNIPEDKRKQLQRTIEREGPNQSVIHRVPLRGSDDSPLVWFGESSRQARPEVSLVQIEYNTNQNQWEPIEQWQWQDSFLGSPSSQPNDPHFTLEDGLWREMVHYDRVGEDVTHEDYADDEGFTLRFGDGEFGRIPARETIYQLTYRLGGGQSGNIPESALTGYQDELTLEEARAIRPELETRSPGFPFKMDNFVISVDNPVPAQEGKDPESNTKIKQMAPHAYQQTTFRAVQAHDYADAAERLDWVQQSGATFRWTGSWLSVFTTPDPENAVALSETRRDTLNQQLERFRQAGREAHVSEPRYADLDLKITVCVQPDSYSGDVKEAVLEALVPTAADNPEEAFFSPDNFQFGTPLDRLSLEAAIQRVPGVKAVDGIEFRRRGWFDMRPFTEDQYQPGINHIIRVQNDPLHPKRGSVNLKMEGGA